MPAHTPTALALAVAASLYSVSAPLAAAQPAAQASGGQTTLDMASWRDMQCLSMLYMSLTDPNKAQNEELKGALRLNIGYHLGLLNARSPDVAPTTLILSAINKTFTPEGIPADVKSYCQTAAQTVTREGVDIEARINGAIKKAEAAQDEKPQTPPASDGR